MNPVGGKRLEVGQPFDLQVLAVASDHVRRPKRIGNALLVIGGHVARRAIQAPSVDADHPNTLVEHVVTSVGMQARLKIGELRIVEMLGGVGAQQHDFAWRKPVIYLSQCGDNIVPGDKFAGLLVREIEQTPGP